jgi:NDP-sugar pyrophosphorylase family protein
MHGLILAAGDGSRLAADGIAVPKPLVTIGGRPQIARLIETLESLGCASLTCMVRDDLRMPEVVRRRVPRNVVPCRTPSSLHTLVLGLAAAPPGPVFCTMVDTVMTWNDWVRAWTACAGALAQGAPAVLVVAPVPPRDTHPLCVRTDAAGHVTALGSDLRDARWATAGVYGFGQVVRSRAAKAVHEGIERMRGFLSLLVREGALIPLVPVERALDVDRREDLEAANTWLAAETARGPRGEGR